MVVKENKQIKKTLKGLTLEELREYFLYIDEPAFRAEQVFKWMYGDLVDDFGEMNNLPKSLRQRLSKEFNIDTLSLVTSKISTSTKTKKYIFETAEGNKIESVVIPERKRTTLCVSTQVGCPLDCKFCATGLMGYKKNLTAGEIFDQFKLSSKDYKDGEITNIVYMGMGEPLLNFKETVKSLEIFAEELTTGVSLKKITVSTAGIAPKIKELDETGLNVKLAFSLHSCFEDIRSSIMPINEKYSLKENIEVLKDYAKRTGTRITFEYVMLKDINDRSEDIKALAKLMSTMPSKLNIIPFNSLKHMNPSGLAGELESSSRDKIQWFADKLREKNITVMLRNTQGDDIAAACGQLAYPKTHFPRKGADN
ncbi:MAG: 23S rRNA (adenine(2503)-C(2))-methyltransferase RlmN [Ignavibacteriaceae bacterium]|jgi:23S rRNA (adenine2503-C2)-methyltransferase|nr:23S rRNA (adenine(2503)-C(2))-methyltransferase RlmN [Ignavibacteriaceae bacterium]MCW8813376.1 23S rRNA (adenine(2503)-C(2))-methyltransferase RlmN [Chlorobium sp.]MCW8817522.1 23S rRNA (adenine(2503)-C(2))-methyltransferase RlmN [Ignavibacteriaceae bacterium]MCW8822935.1 23S rRNA (adenine(2503)-C(2))-methyltransferase RlmN [Ignavibacteriaceae bacterium]MCW9094261.1 23S rRNA (adenine(2503)-C(2))-methyltransferase RlmN [Ignavibacteriaceae bacterium]